MLRVSPIVKESRHLDQGVVSVPFHFYLPSETPSHTARLTRRRFVFARSPFWKVAMIHERASDETKSRRYNTAQGSVWARSGGTVVSSPRRRERGTPSTHTGILSARAGSRGLDTTAPPNQLGFAPQLHEFGLTSTNLATVLFSAR